jgi:hypothetical protein
MSKFYILNGPPGIGKDTIAKYVTDHDNTFKQLEFKSGLYVATAERYGVDKSWFKRVAVDRILKETPLSLLGNISPREAMIDTSENYIKPKFGKEYFGRALVRASEEHPVDNFVISDGGFVEEALAIIEAGHTVHVIQLRHPNFNYNNDSRDYVVVPGAYLHSINVVMGDPEEGYLQFLNILNSNPEAKLVY